MKAQNKLTNINDLVEFLAGTAMQPLLEDEIWRSYGYRKRPKKGAIWDKVFPKKFDLENYITKEVLTLGLIDALNGIKKSNKTRELKLLISLGVVDQFILTTKYMFDPASFLDSLFNSYTSFLKYDKSKLHESIILKAKNILNKKDFVKFMVGTISLLGTSSHEDGFFLKSSYFENVVNKSPAKNKLKIFMSEKIYKKYGALLSEKILKV